MKMFSITGSGKATKIFINPEQVVSVADHGNGTAVRLNQHDKDGNPLIIHCQETVDQVQKAVGNNS